MTHVRKKAVPGGGTAKVTKIGGTMVKPRPVTRPGALQRIAAKPAPARRTEQHRLNDLRELLCRLGLSVLKEHLAAADQPTEGLDPLVEGAASAEAVQRAAVTLANLNGTISIEDATALLTDLLNKAIKVAKMAHRPRREPGVSPTGAHALRAAFGLSTSPGQVEKSAKEMTENAQRAAKATNAGSEGRRPDPLPAAARPAAPARPVPSAQERPIPNTAGAPPFMSPALAAVWQAVYALWSKAGRRSVSVDPAELAKLTGLSIAEVRAAIEALLATGQLQKDPGRAGAAFPRLSPTV